MKRILISIFVILMLALAACGTAASATQQTEPAPQDRTLPIQMQILVGTFKLEGTDQAVTSPQAAELLPLWQVYKDLSSSDTAAQEEIDGLIQQIQDTMTPEQMSAIEAMQLTREDMGAIMEEQGISMGARPGAGNTDDNSNNQGGGGFMPPEGGMPPGGMPGGDPGMGPGQGPGQGAGGQTLDPEQLATAQAARAQGGGFNRLPPGLIDALIQFLEKKASS